MLTLSICCIVLLPGGAICAVQAAPTGTTNENGKRFALPSGSVCSYQCPTPSSIPDASDQRTSYPPDGITGAPYGTTGTTCTYNYKRTVPAACLYTRSTSVLNSSSSSNLACPSTLTSSGDCPASATYSGTPVKLLSWTATTKYKTCNFPGDTYDASGTCSYTNSNGQLISGMTSCPTSLPSYCGARKKSFVGQETDLIRKIKGRQWSRGKDE